jgi:hypothetical protein
MLSCIFILKPLKNGANTTGRQSNTRIGLAIIEMNRVAIKGEGGAARKDDVVLIPAPLVGFFRAEEPFVNAN